MGNVRQNTNRMNVLNGVYVMEASLLASFLEIDLIEEKGGSNCVVDLRLECIKSNPNIVRCTDMKNIIVGKS